MTLPPSRRNLRPVPKRRDDLDLVAIGKEAERELRAAIKRKRRKHDQKKPERRK
jgi:hypothetical protein